MIEKLKIHPTFCGAETMICKKLNELIDYVDLHIKVTDHNFDVNKSRIENLEEKSILKPDYDPDDVKFTDETYHRRNGVYDELKPVHHFAKEGTFEWALIQMKEGKKISREGSDDIYYLTQFGSLMHIHEERGESMLDSMEINQDDLLAIDWKIV